MRKDIKNAKKHISEGFKKKLSNVQKDIKNVDKKMLVQSMPLIYIPTQAAKQVAKSTTKLNKSSLATNLKSKIKKSKPKT